MPFKKIDVQDLINSELKKDPEFNKSWDENRQEYKLIGDLIQKRKEKGLSQADLSERTGIKQQVISRIENRENSPTLKILNKIAGALDCDVKLVSRHKAESHM